MDPMRQLLRIWGWICNRVIGEDERSTVSYPPTRREESRAERRILCTSCGSGEGEMLSAARAQAEGITDWPTELSMAPSPLARGWGRVSPRLFRILALPDPVPHSGIISGTGRKTQYAQASACSCEIQDAVAVCLKMVGEQCAWRWLQRPSVFHALPSSLGTMLWHPLSHRYGHHITQAYLFKGFET